MMEETSVQKQVEETADVIGERRLWTAVIVHAVQDWLSGTLRDKREAQKFLFEDSEDFHQVCAGAGLDPSNFRSKLLRVGRRVETQGQLTHALAA
jgi:hypothetical protein